MEEPTLPTPDELGVTAEEYARIVRDLQQRGLGGEAVAFAAELSRTSVPDDPRGLYDAPAAVPGRPASARPRRWPLVLAVLLVLLPVGWRTLAGRAHQAPAYTFMHTVDGHPVTYSSCKPVQVAVYPANGPSDAVELVQQAIAQMRAATGLDFVFVGAFGGHAPNWNFKAAPIRPDDPVAVSWQDGDSIAELTDDLAGLGGSFVIPSPNGSHLASGTIALSRAEYARLERRGDRAEELAVLLHEFGHVVGLGHVNSSGELMYHGNIGRTSFGPGDLQGLRRAGQGPCV